MKRRSGVELDVQSRYGLEPDARRQSVVELDVDLALSGT